MTKFCINCGEKVKKTDIFCPFCGGDINKEQPSTQDLKMDTTVCSTCYAVNKASTVFCESCGNSIDSFSSSSTGSYGSTTSTTTDPTRKWYIPPKRTKWYKPPKRTRSAKHPVEWFFWTGWGFYVLIRGILWVLWYVFRLFLRMKGRRYFYVKK